ncbi:hypothetical protein LCGC14_1744060, partial [marine sediment metagenome]
MPKRYYWLKISEHFFDDDNIKWLESQENGIEYVYFWIKLLLKCLKNKDSGEYGMLRFTERIPYDDNTLSKFTNTPVDTVRVAMKLFQELGMLEILENKTIYIEAVNKMIGKETDAADRMRKMRNKGEYKLLRDDRNNVTQELRYKELEIDKDIEIDLEKEKEKITEIKLEYSEKVFLTEKQFNTLICDYGKNITISAIEILSNYKCSKNKKYESDYHALLTWAIKEAAGKDRQLVKAEKTAKDEERERKRKIEDDIEQGKMEKLPPGMTRELIDGALKKSDFLNKKEDVDNNEANQQEDHPWGV